MKNKLIINTNILQALEVFNPESESSIYSPVVQTPPQTDFYQRRFSELKKHYPHLEYKPVSDIKELADGDQYALCDAFYEQKLVNKNQILKQNRLFNSFSEVADGFSAFKKLA